MGPYCTHSCPPPPKPKIIRSTFDRRLGNHRSAKYPTLQEHNTTEAMSHFKMLLNDAPQRPDGRCPFYFRRLQPLHRYAKSLPFLGSIHLACFYFAHQVKCSLSALMHLKLSSTKLLLPPKLSREEEWQRPHFKMS